MRLGREKKHKVNSELYQTYLTMYFEQQSKIASDVVVMSAVCLKLFNFK